MHTERANRGKWKGRFIKKTVKTKVEKLSKVNRHIRKVGIPSEAVEQVIEEINSNHNLQGRRIIELDTFASNSWCPQCESRLKIENTVNEKYRGLASDLTIRCKECGLCTDVSLCKNSKNRKLCDVNLKAAIGMIDSGIGACQLNSILSSINVRPVSSQLLKRSERLVGPKIEELAQESCLQAIQLEMELTRVNENKSLSNTDEVLGLKASFDGAWQKRGRAHNSLSGILLHFISNCGKTIKGDWPSN